VGFRIFFVLRVSKSQITDILRKYDESGISLRNSEPSMDEVAVLEVRTGVDTRMRGTGGGQLQAYELAVPVRDEVAPGENYRMTQRAAYP